MALIASTASSGLDRHGVRASEAMRFSYTRIPSAGTPSRCRLLTAKNRDDLTACAENILLAREAHFPATIAELYDSEKMPENLRAAHERNDEVLERVYIGRRFRNDTERLEKLFELYAKTTAPKTDFAQGRRESRTRERHRGW